jgi:hypothetical protein
MKKIENTSNESNDISRKEVVNKMGKCATLAATGTCMILNSKKAQAASGPPSLGVSQ